jgi:hypothetical protein
MAISFEPRRVKDIKAQRIHHDSFVLLRVFVASWFVQFQKNLSCFLYLQPVKDFGEHCMPLLSSTAEAKAKAGSEGRSRSSMDRIPACRQAGKFPKLLIQV